MFKRPWKYVPVGGIDCNPPYRPLKSVEGEIVGHDFSPQYREAAYKSRAARFEVGR